MLDFRIGTFLKLCETKSYTNTAKLLHITQPSVTQHIKYLQKYYQCKLFTYEGKMLRLTPEGEYLRRQAEEMMRSSEKVMEDLQRLSTKRKPLRFGCTKSFGETVVPRLIGTIMAADEDLELTLQVENTQTLLEMLECGRVDFILADQSFAKSNYECYPLGTNKFCGWADPAHADALYGLSLKRMFRERILLREEGSGTRMVLEEILEQRSCGINDFYAAMVCNTPASIRELTAAGVGISFGFECCMEDAVQQNQVQKLYLSDFSEERQIALLYLKNSIFTDSFLPFFDSFKKAWQAQELDK